VRRIVSRRGWRAACGALALGLAACQSANTTPPGAIGVDRPKRTSPPVSEADLRAGAGQAYAEALAQAQRAGALNADAEMTERVRRIAQRLVAATSAFRPDAPGWPWDVNVIQSDQVNAWCMPGGKIAVYSGLITKLNLSDDEIAAVLGHEMAHALREHARERASERVAAGRTLQAAAGEAGAPGAPVDMAQLAREITLGLPNSRVHETEADRLGVELAARAGYDPRAALSLWQKMLKVEGKGPEWLGAHPAADTRTRDLELYAARVMPLYEQARSAR